MRAAGHGGRSERGERRRHRVGGARPSAAGRKELRENRGRLPQTEFGGDVGAVRAPNTAIPSVGELEVGGIHQRTKLAMAAPNAAAAVMSVPTTAQNVSTVEAGSTRKYS
jgi:hypothetical protein